MKYLSPKIELDVIWRHVDGVLKQPTWTSRVVRVVTKNVDISVPVKATLKSLFLTTSGVFSVSTLLAF